VTTDYTHPLYDHFAPLWHRVRDAVAGEDAVKAARTKYLPRPNETDTSLQEIARYDTYLRRAVYYNATGRTLAGIIGVAYSNWPTVVTSKKELLVDVGSGVTIIGQSQMVLSDVLQTGRAGLLADYTKGDLVSRQMTVAEQEKKGIRSFIANYTAEQILTWEVSGGKLTRVVLMEEHEQREDGMIKFLPQLRELKLTEDGYTVAIWRKYTEEGTFLLVEEVLVGLSYIPFTFVGAVNNDPRPDLPPLLDLATLNLAHYRNSADYEESVFLLGQPMFILTGITEEWRENNPNAYVGARTAIALPEGSDAKLLQVSPNTLAKEAMDNKERQMQALGARIMAQGEAVKTATQSAAETKAAYSQLSLACDNVSEAYTRVLQWLEVWGSGRSSNASFSIDTHFNDLTLDANAIRETVAAWQAGLVPQSDAVTILQRLGVIDQGKTPEQVAAEVESQGPGLNLDAAA
jgi:hypothetical protein